jgi:hypothetical protein
MLTSIPTYKCSLCGHTQEYACVLPPPLVEVHCGLLMTVVSKRTGTVTLGPNGKLVIEEDGSRRNS